MKAELKDGILYLRGESDAEDKFLKKAGREGLRLFGTGSVTTLALPSIARLKQFHLGPEKVTMLTYALGLADKDLRRSHGDEAVDLLLSEIFKFPIGDVER